MHPGLWTGFCPTSRKSARSTLAPVSLSARADARPPWRGAAAPSAVALPEPPSGFHVRRPDDLVQLRLEAHWQSIRYHHLSQFLPRQGRLALGHSFQRLVLLFRFQWMHPREKQRTNQVQAVLLDLCFRPVVILTCPYH